MPPPFPGGPLWLWFLSPHPQPGLDGSLLGGVDAGCDSGGLFWGAGAGLGGTAAAAGSGEGGVGAGGGDGAG